MDLKKVNELLEKLDGNHSEIYHIIKDRLVDYPDEDIPFAGEFLFFEERYLLIKKHLIENSNECKRIVDIGCQFGFQTEIFPEYDYTGIDVYNNRFFNTEKSNVKYIVGSFPNKVDVDLSDSIVISSMSLGYFNSYIDKNEEVALKIIVDKLKTANHVFIATTPELHAMLRKIFPHHQLIHESKVMSDRFDMYYYSK